MGLASQRGTWGSHRELLVFGEVVAKKGELRRQYKLWQLRKETISQSPPFHHAYSCEERHSLCLNDPGDSRELKINLHFETLQLQGEQTGEKKCFLPHRNCCSVTPHSAPALPPLPHCGVIGLNGLCRNVSVVYSLHLTDACMQTTAES